MENKNLKNIFVAAGLAVFAGVLTLGVNAAFGLDVPSQDPAGAALHSPVFDGVDVQGSIKNSNADVTVNDGLKIFGDTTVNGGLKLNSDMGGVSVTGNLGMLPLKANLWVGGKNYLDANSVTIDGDKGEISAEEGTLTIPSVLDAKGGIKNTTVVVEGLSNIPKPVKIDDALEVANNAMINGNLLATQDAIITKNLNVSGNINVVKNLNMSGKLKLPSEDGEIKNNDDNPILQTWWSNTFGDYTAINSGYAWTGSEPVSVVAGASGVFFMKGNNGVPYASQLAKIDLNGNLGTTGNITANKIGNFVDTKSITYTSIPVNDEMGVQKTVSCPAGYTVLSCGHNITYWDGSAYVDYKGSEITIGRLIAKVADGTCVGHFVNKTVSTKYVKVYAVCFNPSVNN